MQNYLLSVLIALSTLFGQTVALAEETPFKVQVVNEIAQSKDSIYNGVLLWMAEVFKSSEAVIDLQDREMGKIHVPPGNFSHTISLPSR